MLYLISWLTDFTSNQLVFAVTRRLAELGAEPFAIGLVGTCHAAASTLCNPVSGQLSDRFGRRGVAIAGAVLLLGSFLATWWLPPEHWTAVAAFACGGLMVLAMAGNAAMLTLGLAALALLIGCNYFVSHARNGCRC